MNNHKNNITPADIVSEMQTSYLDYAMSVIVTRALPDVRDGLKPVHRRILYAMKELGLTHHAKFRKSAAVVGEVLGKYHPHGDISVYDALVRMAQDFSYRHPLITGQGNFGCFTKDTKVKLTDGRDLSFEELVQEHLQGKKNYTYTINGEGLIAIAEIRNPRMTAKNAELIKVTLDNGEEIKCTPNHRFMQRNGSYKEAQNLKPGESLMPVYQKLSTKQDNFNREGHTLIYQNKTRTWAPAHHLADNYNLTIRKYPKNDGRARHHVDFNKLNNNPDNIVRVGLGEHWKIHYLQASIQHNGKKRNELYDYGGATTLEEGKYYGNDSNPVTRALNKNHKVANVEILNSQEDVYDLTIDKSHNFALAAGVFVHNSVDGDSPAAMRYTEVKMAPIAEALLTDIEKNTVDFIQNYDNTRMEPTLLPAAFPHLLVNGSLGIAVGMATNIPPHNLGEVIGGAIHLIDNPKATSTDLTRFVKGPDFPTGGLMYNPNDIAVAYKTGRGGVVTRGEAEIVENKKGAYQIIIGSLPYQVNKAELISKMAGFVQEKKLNGIRDIRDESDREGLRVVIDLKGDAYPQKVLNYLYKHTDLERTFHFNMLALVDGIQPKTLSLKEILEEFIKARVTTIERRTRFDLDVAKKRVHILEGLSKALKHIEAVIKTIKASSDREHARISLIKKFRLSEAQSIAILEMRLQTLAGLERKKIEDELKEKRELVKNLEALLKSPKKIRELMKKEMEGVKEKFANERRTRIIKTAAKTISIEDIVPEEEQIMILTAGGYLKRVRPQAYRAQRRGGKGVMGGGSAEDVVLNFVSAGTHDDLLFFSTKGKVYQTKMYEIPEATRTAKGKAVVNFLALGPGETITSVLALPKNKRGKEAALVMVTEQGIIKKTNAAFFQDVRKSGIIAIALKKNDMLRWARLVEQNDRIMLFSKRGLGIRFKESGIRFMGRTARGVRGMQLKGEDAVVGCEIIKAAMENPEVFVISENGYGKRTRIREFKIQRRGGNGVKTMNTTAKTGHLVATAIVTGDEEFIAVSQKGKTIRTTVKEIPRLGRATQGVRIMKLESKDHIASMTPL